MTFRSGSIAAASFALAAVILSAVVVLERVMLTAQPVVLAIDPAPTPAVTAPADVAPAAPQRVELLHAVPSTVAVSSTVDNAAILPEHLVDGDLATAWNSRTGDTTGAWIAFRVPSEVHVDQIRMSAGFTHRGPEGDLFTMNQRIQQVRVSRAGIVILEKRLDPGSRDLQELPIGTDGGDFRIEVTELIPGTEARWREVCVSELEVWGTLPASMTSARQQPTVRVGSLDIQPALGIRVHGGATTLPLAIAAQGWAYLGREEVDPGRGAVRSEPIYFSSEPFAVGFDLHRAVDPAALPRRYRAARQLPVVVYGAHFEPLCEGVLGSLEVIVRVRADELRAAPTVGDPASDRWTPPYSIVAKIDAVCADTAHWVRGADLSPLPAVVAQASPDSTAHAIDAEFQLLVSDHVFGLCEGSSPTIVYVPPSTRRGHGYISASLSTSECEVALWGLWETSGQALPNLIAGPEPYDVLDGAVDIDGDGAPEILTDMGEIVDGRYIPWIRDLHRTQPRESFGCSGGPV